MHMLPAPGVASSSGGKLYSYMSDWMRTGPWIDPFLNSNLKPLLGKVVLLPKAMAGQAVPPR